MSSEALARHPWACLAVVLGLSALAATQLGGARTRYEIEDFFPRETAEYAVYERVSAAFGRDDRTAVVLVDGAAPLSLEQWEALRALTDGLEGCALLSGVVSATNVELPLPHPQGGVRLQPAFPPGPLNRGRLEEVFAALDRPLFREGLVSLDRRVTLVACQLRPEHTDFGGRAELLDLLRERTAPLAALGLRVQLGGYPLQRVELSRLAGGESAVFLPWALGLIVLALALSLRSVAAVVLPLCAASGGALWLTATLVVIELPPNVFAPATYVIVVVVGVADSVHLLSRFAELRGEGLAPPAAVRGALRDALWPCFWASLTTAIGFATLRFTGVPMLADMGVQVGLGVAFAFVCTVLLFPAATRLPGLARLGLGRRLVRLDARFARRPALTLGVCLAGVALAAAGAWQLRVNSPLLSDLDPEHPLRVGNRLMEEQLSGVIPLDVLIAPPRAEGRVNLAAYTGERLRRVDAFTCALRADPGVRSATSAVDVLHDLVGVLERVPRSEAPDLLPTALLLVPQRLEPWLAEDDDLLRVRLRIRDLDTQDALALFARIRDLARTELQEPVELSGQGYLAQVANATLVERFQAAFWSALLAVGFVLVCVTRDLRLALAAVAVNLIPVAVVAGLMGWLGIELRYTSALVLSIVFGIAVDDTLHFVAQLRRSAGSDRLGAAMLRAGPGLVLTSLVLGLGFAVLLGSAFLPLRAMGGLLMATSATALIADVVVLPAALRLTGWERATLGRAA
ncbi:MAG: MMPL family transporter [Planctomycetes bacterium]|nr:MMPL family transporter [Planctomycetota bacterium]